MTTPFLKKAGEAFFVDSQFTKASQLLVPWDGNHVEFFGLIGIPLAKTSISHSGAHLTPSVIRKLFSSYSTYAASNQVDLVDSKITDFGDVEMHVTDNRESVQRIYETVSSLLQQYPTIIPITLGGDHGISFPTIKAFAQHRGKVGIIQFDAHHDLRNVEDGGRSNGTPFRSLLEEGVITGNQLVQIGIRDFSNSYAYSKYAKEKGITCYSMKQVKEQGIAKILEESMVLLKQCDVIYVSVDMDVLDMMYAPGCPAIGPGGMDSTSLLEAIHIVGKNNKVKGMDIVEIDPTVDFRDMTSRMAVHVILQFLLGKKLLDEAVLL